MRKLATIRQISKLLPIKGKDRIMLAIIDGWSVIVKKDEFKAGDCCVFFEIDSFLPKEEPYSFLKPTTYKGKEGYRIKTMKMAGALSQGLALPLSTLSLPSLKPGTDVTDALNVTKYDVAWATRPQGPKDQTKGKFPSFLSKTDQERVQNCTYLFETNPDAVFEETLKLDGSSMTCYKTNRTLTLWDKIKRAFFIRVPTIHFGVCSRNLELKPSDSNFWKAARKYSIDKELPIGFAIQGELIAPNIQSNHEKVDDVEFYIFDVWDIAQQRYLLPSERYEFIKRIPSAKHVPIVNHESQPLKGTLGKLLASVEGESINPGTISEGRVYKHTTSNLSFKAISNKYLLKCEQ